MTGGYDAFVCCATQGLKCGCNRGNGSCTSSGKWILNIWIGDARDDCVTIHRDTPCKAIKVRCENCQDIINQCSTNESKMFCCKVPLRAQQPATWKIHPFIIWTYQPNGSAFHLCVENVWERYFNLRTDTSSTMFIFATQRCNANTGVTNNSKALVSDVQESQEKASVFCRRKIFTIRRLSAQMVQIYVS